jgi:nucleotide-binding universal stress UspA family protein
MYRKILVPLDGSPHYEAVLTEVEDLAILTGAEIALLSADWFHSPVMTGSRQPSNALRRARNYVKNIQNRLRKRGFQVSSYVYYDHPGSHALEEKIWRNVDLVAMRGPDDAGAQKWRLGDTTKRILKNNPRPVMVVETNKAKTAYNVA